MSAVTPKDDGQGSNPAESYLTVKELAERLKLSTWSVKRKMLDGTFQQDVHWFSRPGIRPRFKWSAIVEWLEQPRPKEQIPMARGYYLGK
ncbi:MAG: hypothetical protein WD688_18570 [Candidatus Binatia bacterium]